MHFYIWQGVSKFVEHASLGMGSFQKWIESVVRIVLQQFKESYVLQ